MIEIFIPGNENFSINGDITVEPIECDVSSSFDNVWELNIIHPIDELGRWKYISEDAVLRVPSFNGEQLFRVRHVEKTDDGVTASARPIWMDAQNELFIVDTRPTNKNGQAALNDILKGNNKYYGKSDIVKRSTAYYILKNPAEAILTADNSFLVRWGGEVLYDNYTIIVNERVGGDYGVELLYGKNIPLNGLTETVDMDEVVTRIVPKAFNGYTLTGNTPWVDSPLISNYPIVRTKVIEYEHIRLASDVETTDTDGLIICNTLTELRNELKKAAEEEFNNGIDKPKVTIKCEMVLLQNTEEYKNYQQLEKVSLGDTIYCNHSKLGIVTTARITELVWDCINEKVKSVTIGEVEKSFVSRITTSVNSTEKALTKNGSVLAQQISGIIDMGLAQLKYQQDIAKRQDVRAIIFEDLDSNSDTFGAMCLGTQGFQISRERTPDNRDWVWTTAATSEGIVANTLIAQDKLYVAKHFFADENGVHITKDEYDYVTGNNVFIDSNSIDIREGSKVIASFGKNVYIGDETNSIKINSSGIIISKNNKQGVRIEANATRFYDEYGKLSGSILQGQNGGEAAVEEFDQTQIFTKSGNSYSPTTKTFTKVLSETPVKVAGETFFTITGAISDSGHSEVIFLTLDNFDIEYSTTVANQEKDTSGITTTTSEITVIAKIISDTNTLQITLQSPKGTGNFTVSLGDVLYFKFKSTSLYRFGDSLNNTTPMSFAVGKNSANTSGRLFIVGNGTSTSNRSNAFEVDDQGYIYSNGFNTDYINADSIHARYIDVDSIESNGTSLIIGNATTSDIQIWGNTSNKVGIAITNRDDLKRYALVAKQNFLQVYNYTDSETVFNVHPYIFLAGETFTVPIGPYNGYISSSSKQLKIFIPTPRQANRTVTCPKVGIIIRETGQGYLDDSFNDQTVGTTSDYTWTVSGKTNGILLTIAKSTAYANASNNGTVSVEFRSNLVFTFS